MRAMTALFLAAWLSAGQAAEPAKAKGAYLGGMETHYPAWFKESFLDLRADIAEAKQANKRVVLLFTQDNCPYCNALVERNLSQRDIEEKLKTNFEVIALNLWGDREVTGLDGKPYTEKSFGIANKVQFTPTLVFFDEAGQVVLRLNGYVPPTRFKAALDWVADRGESKQPFREYVAGLEGAGDGKGELIAEPFFKKTNDLRRRGKAAKPLAVFFEQKDCPDCATLHQRVLPDPDVQKQIARFDAVQVDMWSRDALTAPDGRKTTARDWAKKLDVKYAPGIVLFDEKGREIVRWEAGFRAFHTAGMFDYVASGAHRKETNFQRYLSARAEHVRESGRDVNIWRYADE